MAHRLSRSRLLAASGAALALAPARLFAQAPEKIRLVGVQTDDLTPIYWGLQTGMYAKAGLDIEMVAANSGTAATAAVVSGAYELGKGSVIASLIAHIRGLPLVLVANGVVWDEKAPITLAVVAKDSTIKTGADLNNKIGSAPALNDLGTLGIDVWMDKTGGNSKTLKWIEIPNSAQGVTIAAHRSDVCTLNEPALHRGDRGGAGTPIGAVLECHRRALRHRHLLRQQGLGRQAPGGRPRLCARHLRSCGVYQHPYRSDSSDDVAGDEDPAGDDAQDLPRSGRNVVRPGAPPARHRRRRQVRQHPVDLRRERHLHRIVVTTPVFRAPARRRACRGS